ncbi:hypothetical protein D9619_007534 [Psilocybe cf. subviscida]|uniref:Major facilitator superfamily (MFS) profile domain-containing protein n=1 Tax=Psilocybe cf. subviscida TaxID=2480587 RepID=A0A8H5EWI2_9AGAR|nr:hypothetical protein D9619_007534 [Psilocybe cf. subviscida]
MLRTSFLLTSLLARLFLIAGARYEIVCRSGCASVLQILPSSALEPCQPVPRSNHFLASFCGVAFNQKVVLQQIEFDEFPFKVSTGYLIITALAFVTSYYVTVLTIEILGRKTIQILSFLLTS